MNNINLYKIENAVDSIYTEKTGMPYPVGAAVKIEANNLVAHYSMGYYYGQPIKTNWVLTADLKVKNIPTGWYGAIVGCTVSGAGATGCGLVGVFNEQDIQDGSLYFRMPLNGSSRMEEFLSPAHIAIFDNEGDAENYYYDADDPYVPQGIMYSQAEFTVTEQQNPDMIVNMGNIVVEINPSDWRVRADLSIDNAPEPQDWVGDFAVVENGGVLFNVQINESDIINGRIDKTIQESITTLPTTNISELIIWYLSPFSDIVLYENNSLPFTLVNNTL